MSTIQGSLYYNEKKVYVPLGETNLGQGLVSVLEYRKISEDAEFVVLRLKNIGSQETYRIKDVKTVDILFSSKETPIYHTLSGDSCGEVSFMPIEFRLEEAYHEEPFGGRSSNITGFPYFDLTYEDKTEVIAIGWTGQWSKDIIPCEEGFHIQVGLCDSDFYLLPGEEVRFPSVLIVHGNGASKTRRRFREIMREEFSPKKYLGNKLEIPVAIQCFDRYFQGISNAKKDDSWATEEGQLRTLEAAKKAKYLDTLWLDAAWFAEGFPHGVGNYRFSDGFPCGLKPVSDEVHKSGMKFVLWFEPERVYAGSDLYNQEEMLLKLSEDDPTRLFNLSDEKARKWIEDMLKRMIRDNGVDVYRQDFNMEPLEYWRKNDKEGRKGITEMKYVAGLYELWDALLLEFPNLLIDNCASGGRRLDLETSMRSVTLWRSDTGCVNEDENNRVTAWSQNQIMGLSMYLPYHSCAIWEPDTYTVRSCTTHGLACNFDVFNSDFDFAQATKVLAEVHEMKKYWDGDFYPLTEVTNDESVWSAYQLDLKGQGIVYVFRREESAEAVNIISFCAVDMDREYTLTFIDENFNQSQTTVTGKELANGIEVTIERSRNSLIVEYC